MLYINWHFTYLLTYLKYVLFLAMHCAASKGHADCLATLLQQPGVDVNAADKNGCTALSYAASYDHCAALLRLLQSQADSRHRDNHGRTWVYSPLLGNRLMSSDAQNFEI